MELHGGERINPEADLDFCVREAVQTAYDALRLSELLDETEAPQLILCRAFLAPSGEVPEFANGAWYALLHQGYNRVKACCRKAHTIFVKYLGMGI